MERSCENKNRQKSARTTRLTCLRPPGVLLQRGEQRRQHKFHPVGAQLSHNGLCTLLRSLPYVLVRVAEAEKQVRQNVDNVRFKETTQHGAQLLESQQGTYGMSETATMMMTIRAWTWNKHGAYWDTTSLLEHEYTTTHLHGGDDSSCPGSRQSGEA